MPVFGQTPPDPDPGSTQVDEALRDLGDRDVGGGVSLRDWFYQLGVSLWGAMALTMIAWQGIQIGLGARFQMGDMVKFIFWIAVPRMILDGFYTEYELFGDQTFVDMVTNQGTAMAAALNPAGGAWTQALNEVLGAVGGMLGKVLQISIFGDVGIWSGLTALAQVALMYVVLMIVTVLGLVVVLLALVLVYVQTLWAEVAVGMMSLAGPVFVPFLLVEQLSFLFWSWFKAILQYSLQVFVGGMMMALIGQLALGPITNMGTLVEDINPTPGEGGVTLGIADLWEQLVFPTLEWFPIMLCCLFMSLKVGEFTAAFVSGMGAPTSGMAGVALAAMTAGKSVALRAGAAMAKRAARTGF